MLQLILKFVAKFRRLIHLNNRKCVLRYAFLPNLEPISETLERDEFLAKYPFRVLGRRLRMPVLVVNFGEILAKSISNFPRKAENLTIHQAITDIYSNNQPPIWKPKAIWSAVAKPKDIAVTKPNKHLFWRYFLKNQ